MRKLLNALFVTSQGAYLARQGQTIAVRIEKTTRLRVPIHTIEGVVCFGRVSMNPALMELCGCRGVGVSFLSERGRFLARVVGPVSGNVLLRREQYRRADDRTIAASVAQALVAAKIANARAVLQRALRDHSEQVAPEPVMAAVDHLGAALRVLREPLDLERIRGIEGDCAREYFAVFDRLIVAQRESFCFSERSRRPPRDRINAMLSFLYAVLAHDVSSALQAIGLDPAVGFLHRDRSGRPSLALDLMEEMRAYLVDRLVLSLVNRRQVHPEGFAITETGAVTIDDATRNAVLVAWQKRKQEEITHPFLEEKIAVGLIPYVQALLLSRYLRGDLERYPSFFWT